MATLLRNALTLSQLRAAFARVEENNGQPGVDGVAIARFGARLGDELQALRLEVLGGRYRPLPLKRLWLPRPGRTPRPLAVPAVRDRVLQTAVAQVLTPLCEAEFEECSFAYRQGRSVRMAVERIGLLQRQGYRWVVEADIEQFFDRIPHDRLLRELKRLARDDELIELVRLWLTAPVREGENLTSTTLGVAQGSPLSPLLANLYLDHLDEALLDQGHALVRYADDFVVLAKHRDRAEAAVELSTQVLKDLELKLNPLKTRVVNFETGFKFLGWNFVRSLAVPATPAGQDRARAAAPMATAPSAGGIRDAAAPWPANSELADAFAEALCANPAWSPAPPPPGETEHTVETADAPVHPPNAGEAALVAPASPPAPPPRTQDDPAAVPPSGDESDPDDAEPALPPPSLQRTLYLVDPAVSLATENHHLLVRRGEETVLDLPAVNVDQVMLFGRNPVTTAAMVCCLQHGIPVAFLTRMGKFRGRLEPPQGENVHLLAAQFAVHAEGRLDLPLAREIVHGKLSNSALLLSRHLRHRKGPEPGKIEAAIEQLKDLARRTRGAADLDSLRGLEGAGAAAYFAAWRLWLAPRWNFGARVARAGGDPINALLDLGYTLLRQSVAGLIQARGLNSWIGHLHRPKSGHMALASDLMEEFRPLVVDAEVLDACLNGHLQPQDFVARDGAWTLRPEAARLFVRGIETRLNTERQHPRTGERLDPRRIIDAQIRGLASAYRQGDAAPFRACVFR